MQGISWLLFSFITLILISFFVNPIHALEPPVESVKVLTVGDVQETLKTAERAELGLQGLLDLQKAGQVIILDVRSPQSHAMNHIKGSINIPLTDLTERTVTAVIPDKKTPVAVMCDFSLFPTRMLAMTIQAYPVLKAAGYENIYRLNLWQNRDGGSMLTQEDIEKALPFEKQELKPTGDRQ